MSETKKYQIVGPIKFAKRGWRAAYVCDEDRGTAAFFNVVAWAVLRRENESDSVNALVYESESEELVPANMITTDWTGDFLGLLTPEDSESSFHEKAAQIHKEETAADDTRERNDQLVILRERGFDITERQLDSLVGFFGNIDTKKIPKTTIENCLKAWTELDHWRTTGQFTK